MKGIKGRGRAKTEEWEDSVIVAQFSLWSHLPLLFELLTSIPPTSATRVKTMSQRIGFCAFSRTYVHDCRLGAAIDLLCLFDATHVERLYPHLQVTHQEARH